MLSPTRPAEKSNNSIVKGAQQTMSLSLPALVKMFENVYLLHLLLHENSWCSSRRWAQFAPNWVLRPLLGQWLVSVNEQKYIWLLSCWKRLGNILECFRENSHLCRDLCFLQLRFKNCFLETWDSLKDLGPMFEYSGFKTSVKVFLNVLLAEVTKLGDLCTNTKLGQCCLYLFLFSNKNFP